MNYPKVAIVTINWNNYGDVKEWLDSLAKISYPDYEVIIVDNASADDSADRLAREFPRHTLIRSRQNLGWAGGNNLGIRYALEKGIELVLLLNDDTIVEKGFLEPLVEAMAKDEGLGIVGGKIYYYSDPRRIWSAGGRMRGSWLRGMSFSLIGYDEMDAGQFDQPRRVDWCVGALLLVKREVFEKVGLLPDEYFQCMEDGDFEFRVRKAGFGVFYEPRSVIWHKIGVSGLKTPRSIYNSYRNKFLFMERNRPPVSWKLWFLVFRAYFFFSVLMRKKVRQEWRHIDRRTFQEIIKLAIEDHKIKKNITEADLKRAEKILKGAA